MAGVRGTHHVLGVPHLLCELRDGEGTVELGAAGGQGCETDHEEVETWERDEVHGKFSEVGVELSREPEAACDSTHGCGDQMVQITNCKNVDSDSKNPIHNMTK